MKNEFDPLIHDLYTRSAYQVRGNDGQMMTFTLQNASLDETLKGKVFAIITAWNPMNRKLPKKENEARNQLLEKGLKARGYDFYPSRGSLEDYFEESFTVEKMTEKEALAMGTQFEQYAVVVCDEKGCRLVRCPSLPED